MLPPLDRPIPAAERIDLAVMGSTGSIGTQTLDIARQFPDRVRVRALTAGRNHELLAQQARDFRPDLVVIADPDGRAPLAEALSDLPVRVLAGDEALIEAATLPEANVVLAALVGFAGLAPTLAAVRAGKRIALANKETLVVAGQVFRDEARRAGVYILPVDSEHSALFQSLVGESITSVETLLLTASGGPFRTWPAEDFARITPADALNHPNWDMGAKITIDSATMMNKGLEVIEARWMFDLEADRIRVVVHPQSIAHSFVSFVDGSVKSQLGVPDMRVPIQYALSYPARWPADHPRVEFAEIGSLEFEAPDLDRFPCLALAYDALRAGGTAPAVLNAANEVAVALFLQERIRFVDIPVLIEQCLGDADTRVESLAHLREADALARRRAKEHYGMPIH